MDMNAVVPQHPHPLERSPSRNLRREEVQWMSPPYGSNWMTTGFVVSGDVKAFHFKNSGALREVVILRSTI
jgi:hypothetical protein